MQSLPLTTVQSSKAIKKRDELRDRLSERIIHHPNEISPDETRAHDCLVIHDLLNKNPDIKLNISKNQRVKEALEIQEVRRTIVSTGLIFAGIPGYNWELGTYAHSYVLSIVPVNADFHNAELHYIAIISHRRSAYDLLKARGKRLIVIISSGWSFLLSTIIIFLTFVSVSPNIESRLGAECINLLRHSMLDNIYNETGLEMGPTYHYHSNQIRTSPATSSNTNAVNKCSPSRKTETKLKTVYRYPSSYWRTRKEEDSGVSQILLECKLTNDLQERVDLYNRQFKSFQYRLQMEEPPNNRESEMVVA